MNLEFKGGIYLEKKAKFLIRVEPGSNIIIRTSEDTFVTRIVKKKYGMRIY